MDIVEKLKLKIAMLEACNEDLLVAFAFITREGSIIFQQNA
ncbi:hypothetical protein [Lysinibacillus fusiformis]